MTVMIRSDMPNLRRGACKFRLLLVWFAGLLLGYFTASSGDETTLLMMRSAAQAPVSIFGLAVIFCVPFLLSAFAVFFFKPLLFLLPAFCKAFFFGFCVWSLNTVFQSAGWLVCGLLMFSDLCFLPVMMWFWLRHCHTISKNAVTDLAFCAAACTVIGVVDYCIVSPLLAMVL